MDTPDTGPFDLVSQRLGALPLVDHFLDRAGLPCWAGICPPAMPGSGWRRRPRCGWW
jgi:hypothetical protein